MSNLSDQIEAALDQMNREEQKKGMFVKVEESRLASIPGFEAAKDYYGEQAGVRLRHLYRKFAGGPSFTEPTDALEKTAARVLTTFAPVIAQAFADGVQMGQEQTFVFKKYRMFNKLDEVFAVDSWRQESALIALPVESDEDSMNMFKGHLMHSAQHLGPACGYADMSGEQVNKIWDLWYLVLNSTFISMYCAGFRVGKNWKETDTLAGILAATEQKEEAE